MTHFPTQPGETSVTLSTPAAIPTQRPASPVVDKPPFVYVTSPYIDYCRAYAIAVTGGQVVVGSSKDERAAACVMLGADDGIAARHGAGHGRRSKANVEQVVADLLGKSSPKLAA